MYNYTTILYVKRSTYMEVFVCYSRKGEKFRPTTGVKVLPKHITKNGDISVAHPDYEVDLQQIGAIPSYKNEMLELDGIIRKDIIRFLHNSYPLTPPLRQGFNEELGESIKEIKKRIFAGAQHYDVANRRGYILFHQQVLIELAGRLAHHMAYECLPGSEKHNEGRTFLHFLYEALEDLLNFMNTFFASALPGDHWLSVDYYFLVAQEVNEGLDELQKNFRTLSLSEDLVNIALAPLSKFIHRHTDNDLTYRRQTFIKKLKSELSRLYELRGKTITDKDVHQLLFTLNFNSLAYLTYVGQTVRRRIEGLPTVQQKIDVLREIQRDVSQTVQFPEVIFDMQNPQLKAYTMDWLHQEIHYWQNVHEAPFGAPAVQSARSGASDHLVYKGLPRRKANRLKARINLSVKQIAFLFRVLRETGVVEETDMKELLRDLSAIFRSKQMEFVSAKSLYKKLSEVDDYTVTSMWKLFLRLAKHIENVHNVRT